MMAKGMRLAPSSIDDDSSREFVVASPKGQSRSAPIFHPAINPLRVQERSPRTLTVASSPTPLPVRLLPGSQRIAHRSTTFILWLRYRSATLAEEDVAPSVPASGPHPYLMSDPPTAPVRCTTLREVYGLTM